MIVNGKDFDISRLEKTTLFHLVRFFKLQPEMVAVELNGNILEKKKDWKEINLNTGDKIELIKFVGGG